MPISLSRTQQAVIRELLAQRLNLADFRRAERPPPARRAEGSAAKVLISNREEPVE